MDQRSIMKAFKIYAVLQEKGKIALADASAYFQDSQGRGLLESFVTEIDCGLITDEDYLYMVPLTTSSHYHISNDRIKRDFFPARALNRDIYLMYVAILVFFGEFYDSYQRQKPTREFLRSSEWLESLNQRLDGLKQMDEESLKSYEEQFDYSWREIIKTWDAMDTVKEGIRRQTIRSVSKVSFLQIVVRFMQAQELIKEIGPSEYALSQKAKTIIEKYYMDYDYNRGILEFIYQYEKERD